jgi:mRNA interferase MazF
LVDEEKYIPKQGDIIRANLNPKKGHEQKGYRPLVVLSNDIVAKFTNVVIIAPISTTKRRLPLYIKMHDKCKTTGYVLLDQLVTIDYLVRNAKYIEKVPEKFLGKLLDVSRRIFSK